MYLRAVCGTSDHREDRPTEDAHVDKIQEAMVLLMSLVQVWALDDDDLCPAANSTSEGPLGDILTPHVSPSFGFPPCQRVPLSRKLSLTSYAWLTHSVLSSMILPQLSISFLSPTPSQSPIFLLGGTLASAPRPAQHIPANKGTEPALMLRLLTVPRFPSIGGVCSSSTFYCANRLNRAACRQWYPAVRSCHRAYHLRPSARWPDKLLYLPSVGDHPLGFI